MARGTMIYISEHAHAQLKVLAARGRRTMGEVIEEWVEQEAADVAGH
ncbi:MAG: hypothetical protein HYZ53_17090 [Planctomycetes bacterium]|nr:hypothetical protein [Planctomycetota bacterium]